jgi:hypothetical protein
MLAFTAIIAVSLATIAAAATTPARRDLPGQTYPEPGLIHCRTDDCSGTTEGDNADCLFLEYKWLPPGGGGKCLGTSVFRSVISYTPENVTSLPYDVCCEVVDAYRSGMYANYITDLRG